MIPTFLAVPSLSSGEEPYWSKNTLIEGDNLEVFAALPAESIDLIYSDPPYNTEKNGFRYNDRWNTYTPNVPEAV